jgi:Protein of unknown function (DUF4239)
MNFYWLYDIPTWALFCFICSITCLISLIGCVLLRGKFDKWMGLNEETNDIVSHFLSFTGVFYGMVLGLVAVGAWETFDHANERAQNEATSLAAFFRDVSLIPDEPNSNKLEILVRTYTWQVINREWPDQREGKLPEAAQESLRHVADVLYSTPADTPNKVIIIGEAVGQYNKVLEARRARIQSVQDALPSSLWWVIIIGTLINIAMTWLLRIENRYLDVSVNLLMALLMGTVLAFVVAMDNPYRGELSVSADAYQLIYNRVMGGGLGFDADARTGSVK